MTATEKPVVKAALPSNIGKLKACCASLAVNGSIQDEESGIYTAAAAQCNAVAVAAGPGGHVPEDGSLMARLSLKKIPTVCESF